MAENSTTVLQDGQLAVATVTQTGDLITGPSPIDTTALVQTAAGPQLCVKTYSLNGGGAAKPEYVAELPEEGEEGVLYMVNSGETRDGYAIFQMFSWHEGEWVAIGAFDVGIIPTGLVYEHSWDPTTKTMVLSVNQ